MIISVYPIRVVHICKEKLIIHNYEQDKALYSQ